MMASDPYLIPGTNVLQNKLGVKNSNVLDDAEADYTSLRLRELAETPLPGGYDLAHFLAFHQYIFQDIYGWAGTLRTIDIFKGEPVLGGLSIEYSPANNVKKDLSEALSELNFQNPELLAASVANSRRFSRPSRTAI